MLNSTLCQLFFFTIYLVFETIGTAATPGLLCQPQVIVKMIVEKQMECRLAGETEVLGENLPQRHFCRRRLTIDFRSDWQVISRSGHMSAIYLLTVFLTFLIFLSTL
jgi:hypothetical protein